VNAEKALASAGAFFFLRSILLSWNSDGSSLLRLKRLFDWNIVMSRELGKQLSRRELLRGSLLASGALLTGFERIHLLAPGPIAQAGPQRGGRMIGTVDFTEEARVPMGTPFGDELDGRMYTDLSKLTDDNPMPPADAFYIRTRASRLLPSQKQWTVTVGGLVEKPFNLAMVDLEKMAKPMGLHLIECAGNSRQIHFGMMSVAGWTGVPVSRVLDGTKLKHEATRVLISGFDRYATTSVNSVPGASWVFTLDELKTSEAFLATEMDGRALTADHGAPVRLVVPGWYGCACIKWVNEITFVDDSADATTQMQEYAARTMQNGVPPLAKDYKPATVDHAAMPIRVEKWSAQGKIAYRVVGILWGGTSPANKLEIRFNPEQDYVPVDHFQQSLKDSWSFWSHGWKPSETGKYMIRLRVKDPRVVARRLDSGYYLRTVEIEEI
jgi:DMSO/TMAO reductase YedYZ molybdopterin-dependent catalytic subunit